MARGRGSKKLAPLLSEDQRHWNNEKRKLAALISNEAVNFFTESFRRQGFTDQRLSKWKPRKGEKARTGKTRVKDKEARGILIGKGSGNKLSRSIRALNTSKKKVLVGSTVKYAGVHNYGLRAGRGAGFKMPKRQFIGHSKQLARRIRKIIVRKVNRSFDR